MDFAAGLIVGLLISTLAFVILAFFRVSTERVIRIVETKLENAGPRPKGSIILPKDDATIAREEIIKRNKEQGKDTPVSELE